MPMTVSSAMREMIVFSARAVAMTPCSEVMATILSGMLARVEISSMEARETISSLAAIRVIPYMAVLVTTTCMEIASDMAAVTARIVSSGMMATIPSSVPGAATLWMEALDWIAFMPATLTAICYPAATITTFCKFSMAGTTP